MYTVRVSVIPHHQWQLDQFSIIQVHAYHPVSLEPIALPQAHLHQLHRYHDIGELLLESHPAAARSLFQLCYFTSRVWCNDLHTIEYQSCVGECLRVLQLLSDAKVWLWDAYNTMSVILDPVNDTLRNCMLSLGMISIVTQELPQARALLERVALLDELDEGPHALVTLETLLHVATVYRFEGKYNLALETVQMVVDTLVNIRWEPDWCELLCWTALGTLYVNIGDTTLGYIFLEKAFLWRLEHNGPSSNQTWGVFTKWFWLVMYANYWTHEKAKFISWSKQIPRDMEDWPGKNCVVCYDPILGSAYSKVDDPQYTYLYCKKCVDMEGNTNCFVACPSIRDCAKQND
ncbi:hypothetical protein THRCLA_07453 [Thraustotheca clavata]|uniref:Uncharacterized protein n=1 Tax=Thraustotheca clavata TaxID=74557 RepID=A0A1V9ZD82_9STRA|nr:hypothetical protein THRCLA_07453 [Thraustotheca clavata]